LFFFSVLCEIQNSNLELVELKNEKKKNEEQLHEEIKIRFTIRHRRIGIMKLKQFPRFEKIRHRNGEQQRRGGN
jgi:hypothetical protein